MGGPDIPSVFLQQRKNGTTNCTTAIVQFVVLFVVLLVRTCCSVAIYRNS